MVLNTQHVTIGQKLAKTVVLAIYLVLVWFQIGSDDLSETAIEIQSSIT